VDLIAQVALPLQGQYLNSLVGTFRGQTNAWFAAAGNLQYEIFGALLLIALACRIGIVGARAGSAAAVVWQLPSILESMILPLILVPVSVALMGHALGIGEDIGTTITGYEFVGASGLFGAYMTLILEILALPFGAATAVGLPGAWGAALHAVNAVMPVSSVLMGVGLFVLAVVVALRLLKVAEQCTLMLLRCQLDTLIVMPFTLILCAFVPIPGDALWRGAIQVFFRSIFRLAIAIGISSLAIVALRTIAVTLQTVGQAANIYIMLGEIFACVGGAVIVGSLIEGATNSLDAAFAGAIGWGAVMPSAGDVARQAISAARTAAAAL
jgi:hypothetical protein